jgi:ribosome-associated protein
VLDVSTQSSITDFLVVATATSTPHLRALRVELEKALDAGRHRIVGIETAVDSGWTVIDAFDVMVHLFFAARRSHYGLENLWKDAPEIPLGKLLAAPAPRKRRSAVPRARPGAKRLKREPIAVSAVV